jgi:HAD superfamily hydrolase (TIGR01490 family)
MVARPKLALFDLDHTLLDGDSDVLWCDFLVERGVLDGATFGPRNAAMARDYQVGTVGVQAFCDFYVSTLAGRSAAQWEPWRRDFLRGVVAPRIGAAARALVRRHQEEGALVVLTTATNRFITELTAAELGIEHLIATDCEVAADGLFTGRTQGTLNMRDGKVARLHDWLAARGQGLDDFESWAYSDSSNDLPLLQAVHHAVVVHPDARLAAEAVRRGWPVLQLHAPVPS